MYGCSLTPGMGENNLRLLVYSPAPHFSLVLLYSGWSSFLQKGKEAYIHTYVQRLGLWKMAESKLEPSLSTITAGFSPKISPSAMIPEHRKGVFIVSLRSTVLLSKCFQRSSLISLLLAWKKRLRRKIKISHVHKFQCTCAELFNISKGQIESW